MRKSNDLRVSLLFLGPSLGLAALWLLWPKETWAVLDLLWDGVATVAGWLMSWA